MHPYNHQDYIGSDFFEKPSSTRSTTTDYVFNKIFKRIPTTLSFAEQFNTASIVEIEKNFEPMFYNLSQVSGKLMEESTWIGKPGTVYVDALLEAEFRSGSGERLTQSFGSRAGLFQSSDLNAEDVKDNKIFVSLRGSCHTKEQAEEIVKLFTPYKLDSKSKIYVLTNRYGELEFAALPMEIEAVDLKLNYGEEFSEFHDRFIDSLSTKNSGLYMLYGAPGTGKSSYIKHLLSCGIKRKIVYIPVNLIDRLVSPDLLPLLMDNKDIIFVLEDAEKALLSRENDAGGDSFLVSAILNLTDGFIGQAMNISILATFNTAREKIDEALLRKGRLKLSHEFSALTVSQGRALASSLGIDPAKITESLTLADIYNLEDSTGYVPKVKPPAGFGS